MIRPEHHRLPRSDPATSARLADLRASFEGLHSAALNLSSSQARAAEVAASRARRTQVAETHARQEQGSEADRRASDRAFFLRPYNNLGRDLWDHQELRSWYSNGAGTGSLAGADFSGAPLGATLSAAGYTMPASRALPPPPNPFRADAPAPLHPAAPLNSARAALQRDWRHAANGVHWMDREALLPLEARTARAACSEALGFSAGYVAEGRPFKERLGGEDAWRFNPPQGGALRAGMETARVAGAAANLGNAASARATKQSAFATDRADFY